LALKDFVRSQFIEVIEWLDDSGDTVVYRFPVQAQEIKMGARLTVREGQFAVFVSEGSIADVFNPGLHTLSTRNLPVLTKLRAWKHGFNSPFKAEVYFVSSRQFTDQKWGTSNPVMLRDAELGPIRLRAFGIFSFKVHDPAVFMKEIVGTEGHFTTEEINGQLKRLTVSGFSDLLAESNIPAFDLAAKYDELSSKAQAKLDSEFKSHGLTLSKFYVENISLPPEVEEMIDKRASMGVAGDLNRFTQFQTAKAIESAAENPGGGAAAAGVGIGAGAAMGQSMMGAMGQGQATASMMTCGKCARSITAGSAFCNHCGAPQGRTCSKCKATVTPDSKFCSSCGASLS
jgi:membrane protease subunit (stomatin/prohibitin family)